MSEPRNYNDAAAKAAFIARADVQAFTEAVISIKATTKKDSAGHVDLETPLMAVLSTYGREVAEDYVLFRLPHGAYVGGALVRMPDDAQSFAEKMQRIFTRDDTSWELKYSNGAALARSEPELAAQYSGAGLNYLRHALSGARVPDPEDPSSPVIKIKRGGQ